MQRTLFFVAALVLGAARLDAQVVERQEPFDSAGRIEVITPGIAARLELRPPAWRITGDYEGARLYDAGGGYVIVVTRRSGVVERYPITAEDRAYLRARTSTLPPDLEAQLRQAARAAAAEGIRNISGSAFVLHQTLLGLGVYAPSFTIAVTDDEAAAVASYLLVSGLSYFAAVTVAREFQITQPMNALATHAALTGGGAAYGIARALDGSDDARAAAVFVGSIAGTAAGLYFGDALSPAQVAAATFGSWALAVTTGGALMALDEGPEDLGPRTFAAALAGAGLIGYPLGARYPRIADYNVTPGDVSALWVTGALGAGVLATLGADDDIDPATRWALATGGFAGGVLAGDLFVVRRYDLSQTQAALLGLGAGAGALMGAGVYALLDRDRSNEPLLVGMASAGGIAGAALTAYYLVPAADAGRLAGRLRLMPENLALAAAGVHGAHPLVSLTF